MLDRVIAHGAMDMDHLEGSQKAQNPAGLIEPLSRLYKGTNRGSRLRLCLTNPCSRASASASLLPIGVT